MIRIQYFGWKDAREGILERTWPVLTEFIFLISTFRRVLNVVCFLLGNCPASEFYMPTFRNTLFHLLRQVGVKND